MRQLYRLIAQVLVFSLVADPFALAQIQTAAAARNHVAADLRLPGLPGRIDLPSPTATVPAEAAATTLGEPIERAGARRVAATSFMAPTAGPAESGEEAETCAEDLTQRRAPLVSLVKTLLWPPNHPLVDVGLGVSVTPVCEGRVTTRVAVFADEPDEDQTGDGDVPGDARIDGTSLYLRSERKGNGDGRVYLVLTTSTLPDGTSGTACATVTVPRSRSQADLAGVSAQASAAQAYCDANQAPPPSFFELTEGVLTLANVPPAVNAGPDQAVDFPGPAVLHGTATDDGRPNATLSVSWSKVSGPGTVTFDSPGTAETTASFSEAGTYTLRLTANDGQLTASDEAVVVVSIANEAPQVDAGPDQEITLPEDTVTLAGSATDDGRPASSTLTTMWSVLSPAGAAVIFADVHAVETTATLPGAGEYVLRLTADDGQFAVSDDLQVTVHAQPPPVLRIEDTAVPEGHEGTTAAVVPLALSYAWSQPVTVDYMTEDGTAVAGCDYRIAFGTVTFAPGETTAEILVPIAGELATEEDETIRIRVDNVSQATLERTEATLTIRNDDAANSPPGALSGRTPADRANSVALPPTLTWSAADPDVGDVLTYDVQLGSSFATSGQSWARTCPASQGPGPRTAPVAGYDEANDRLILFGGTGTTDAALWILDNASAAGGPSQWTSIPTADGPVGLGHAASVYDAATNRLFVVGGCSGDCLEGSDQTWILTNANGLGGTPTWSLLAGAGPGPRMDHAAAIDPVSRRLIVFGGSNAGASLGDVWLLSLDGQPLWQALPTNGTGPARSGMSASYDPERNVLIVFGGRAGTRALSDTWVLGHANGSGGSAEWSRLAPAGAAPPARWGHAAAYDSVADRLVIYGGSTASANPASRFVFRDVWMLTGAAGSGAPEWIRLSPNAGPAGQVQAAGAFSAPANRLVAVGGTSSTSTATDEIWVLSDAIGTLPLVTSDTGTSFTSDGLTPGTVYYWRIVSRDDHGAARGSAAWRFTSNAPPSVEAGLDQTITLPNSVVTLNGTGTDDGLPTGTLTSEWTASGPSPVAFADASSAVTTASFAAPGTYVLRLTLNDSQLSASDELTVTVLPQAAAGRTWTTTGDFAAGQSLRVNGDGDRVQLDATAGAYPFVWIAVSSKGTIVKIDARTGAILGEYYSAPNGQPRNPSRTTVDLNGNVWTGNRDGNSIVHIGNEENKQCVDRNGNGVIDTSRRFGDLRPWTNTGGADTDGGISTAADECILHYTRVSAQGTRHLSITKDNDVWVSGVSGVVRPFDLVDGRTGFIKRSEPSVGYGGYGGLMDRNGVIWSARPLLRWDPRLPLAGPNGGNWKGLDPIDSYGLCIDPQGNVWETYLEGPTTGNPATSGILRKWHSDGTLLGTFGHGFARAQGCAVDARGDVWVAHTLDSSNTVGHVKNNGAFVGNVTLPSGATGVAVDLYGKIWTSNHNSQNVSRIDPNAGPIGADGVTRIGAVDFTTPHLGGVPYNYSDMTGSTLVGAPREGRWSVVFDSEMVGAKWGLIRWSESRCGDGSLAVRVASSLDGQTFTTDQQVESGQRIPAPDGRYLRVTVAFTRATTGESPILYDLSVGTEAYPVAGDDADQPLQVDAGPDQSVETPNEASLSGSVCDDGRPSGALDVSWSKVSGPGDVRFSDPTQSNTRARFQATGSFDAVEDFSDTANPSGPWSYGWKPTRTGAFTPGVPVMYFGMPSWQRTRVPDFGGLPAIARGPRGQTYSFAGHVFLPAEMLYLHPGSAGQNAVVRWTAPAAGSYRIEGRFQGISTGNPTVDVGILHNATTVFTGNIASFGQASPFALIRDIAAGDVLDFSVGFGNGSFFYDHAGLALRIAPVDAAGIGGTYVLRLSGSDSVGNAQDDVTVTVTTPDCVAPPAGTVAWWPGDGHARDLFGGPSGSLAGGMGYRAGMVGQAFSFDGFDDAVTVPASPALNVQAFTLEGWVFPTDSSNERPIFEYGSPGVFGVHLWQNIKQNPQNRVLERTPGALYANLIDTGGNNHILSTGAGVLVPSTWNHIALTYDPASGKARLYANGRLEIDFGAGTFVPKTNLPFNVGYRPNGGQRFAGGIDEATIVNRALTVAEIQEIYFAGALGKCKAINQRPQVDAGADQEVLLPLKSAALAGAVSDDGLPKGVALKYQWTKVSGPGTVTFSASTSLSTTATFSTTGDYTLQLQADDSELKGSDSVTVSVRPRADLAINSVDVTGMSVDGQTLAISGTVSATITNLGQGPAVRPFTVTFFEDLDANGALDASDTVLGSTSPASLDAGASSAVSAPVSGQVSFAGNIVHAFADSANVIVESDESNNYARSCANGCELPDLTASYVRKEESGDSLILTARIGNGGGSTAAAGVPVSFYDRNPATVGTRITTATTPGALAPGQFVDVSVTVPATTSALPLWVAADDQGGLVGTIAEHDETNNVYNSRLFLSTTHNTGPTVDAGPDQRLVHPQRTAVLDATVDDDGQPLGELTTRWGMVQQPAGATVTFADSTVVDTTATFSATGTYVLRLTADDGPLTASDDVTIVVEPPNQPPVVDAGPNQSITQPTTALDGTVTDDGLPAGSALAVQWSKLQGPGTAAFANASAVDTAVTFDKEGHYVLQLSASDTAANGSDTIQIDVAFANASPVVNAGPDRTLTLPANSLTLTGTATDDGLPLGSTLSVKWSALVSPGVVTFGAPASPETIATFSDPGVYTLRLTAYDGAKQTSDTVNVSVGSTAPVGNAPVVALTAPLDGARVTSPTPVLGSAASDSLVSWKLEYRLEGDTTYTRFAAGTTAVTAGPLGTFDPSLLLNGIYEVRLTATDTAGRNSRISTQVVVKDNLKVGHFSVSFVDLDVPVSGLPIQVTRTYDSRDKGKGDFGIGWRLEMSNVRLAEKGVVGEAFEGTRSSGAFPTYCLQLTQTQVVTVTLTDGTVYEFQPVLTPRCQQFAPIDAATLTYQPLPGTHASLSAAGDGYVFVEGAWPGPMELYDGTTFEIYDPDDYVLTLADGIQLFLNQGTGLTQVRDLNGNTLTVSSNGITHSSGRGITFTRDAQGRITQVTDPDNHSMTYGYDAAGDLVSFTDRETNTTTFTYNLDQPHLLETIKDPRGRQPIRNEYYDDGRIKSHTDAFGKTITYAHDLTGRQEVITDRDGGVRVLEYDERGNVVRETDPEGKVVDRTFDARNNRTSETLPHDPGVTNAPKTIYVYDSLDNLRSMTDPENHTTEYTYNARKQVVLMKDPRGTYTLNAYDAKGNLFSTKTSTSPTGSPVLSEMSSTYRADGNMETETVVVDGVACVTRYEFNGAGYLIKETDGLGHETTYTYDASGNQLTQSTKRTTPRGVETLVTLYEYDKLGRLRKTTDAEGASTETMYDEVGRKRESHDKLGRVTKYDYDDMGRLVLTTYPDLTTEETTYNGEGHRLTFKSRVGRVTKFKYDTLGRLTRTTYPDETFTENVYDAAGRLKETKDAQGNTTFYGYDAAGRRTFVKAPLGGGAFAETVFTYDANGNQRTVRDTNLHTVTYEYDEHNRRTKTIFPDVTYVETTYDPFGRPRAERDQAGKVTKFDYDCLGRLTMVTQRNEGVDLFTHYEYDEVGNRVLQRDANGHETRFEYDKMGRETARTLLDGKTETRTYWPTGSLKTRTDFMGRTTSYDYDANNRLTTRTYPAGTLPTVSFTYTPTGQRKTVTVAGVTTQYEYDLRDRLKTLSYPDGRTLEYDYDGNGNRTALKATIGGQTLTTSFLYDTANRLDVVTDPAGRTYDHGYDPAGNRTSLVYPNGATTTYSYDDLNRLRNLATIHSATGVTIQSYGFTLGPSGNRTKITEGDGTVREYGYDDLYRLTSEKVTIGAIPQYGKTFTYDAVGNRKTQTTDGAGAAGTPLAAGSLTHVYDTRDRLETESGTLAGAPIGITYGYDDNGNLIAKSGEATYAWDVENRLIRIETGPPDGTTVVTYAYDADGNRVQTRITPHTGPPTVTNDLVDSSSSLSHVVAETDESGRLKAYYVRGDDLLAVMRPLVPAPASSADWQTRFAHADGINSIRRLTGEGGAITDGYTYTAFGELIAHTGTDPQPYAFAGEPLDPNSGFYYLRARWMDPGAGRFSSMDSWRGRNSDPRTLHKYAYAHDDPLNFGDPSGLSVIVLGGGMFDYDLDLRARITALRVGRQLLWKASALVGASIATAMIVSNTAGDLPDYGYWGDEVRRTFDEVAAQSIKIALEHFEKFKGSSEFKREGKHRLRFGFPSPPTGRSDEAVVFKRTVGTLEITGYIGGDPGRVFEFDYRIGANAKSGAGRFAFRLDYMDYTTPKPALRPHYHLIYGSREYQSDRHRYFD